MHRREKDKIYMIRFLVPYMEFLRVPQVSWLLVFGALARLPYSMYPLAMILVVQRNTGSLAVAGIVAGSAALGYALFGPLLGRLVDRYGQFRVLVGTAVANFAIFAALLIAVISDTSPVILVALAFAAGGSLPPVASCQRALWPVVIRSAELLNVAFAVEVMLLDAFLIVGPAIVTVLVTLATPEVALGVSAAMIAVGTLGFAASPLSRASRGNSVRKLLVGLGPLAAPGIRTLIVVTALTFLALGLIRVGLVAFAEERSTINVSGLLFTALGVGSLAGSLGFGAITWRLAMRVRYVLLLAGFALVTLPLSVASTLPVMAVLVVLAGSCLGPVTICEMNLMRDCAPEGSLTECYAWAITATYAGAAAGNALGGVLVQIAGWRVEMLVASGVLALAAGYARIRQSNLAENPSLPGAN